MSAYDITGFLRTAYRPFAYCVPSKLPMNTAYQKGGVTLLYELFSVENDVKQIYQTKKSNEF